MITDILLASSIEYWPSLLVVGIAIYLAYNRFNRGLNKYPGPFLASFTDWWRFVDVYKRRPEVTHQKLHAKHGDIVRLGPNYLSFANPKALKTIYGLNKGFVKVLLHIFIPARNYTNIPVCILPRPTICIQWPPTAITLQYHFRTFPCTT